MNQSKRHHITVIGDGAWGTTLAIYLSRKKNKVTLWGPFADNIRAIKRGGTNKKFLPGIRVPASIQLTSDLESAVSAGDIIVLAVPSKFLPGVLKQLGKLDYSGREFISVTKGIDTKTLKRMSQIIHDHLGTVPLGVLSGPTIAYEVAKGIPTTAVIASPNRRLAKSLQALINSDTFRIYYNTDLVGLEIAGSLKNVIAIACGVCDGLGFGTNAKAAILTRGLVEMSRLGKAMGARVSTFNGLAGIGDLVTTCVSPKSRNRYVGEELGKGRSITAILAKMNNVAEGVETVRAAKRLSQKYKVPMPITTEVYNIIVKGKPPKKAVKDLMSRQLKSE